MKIHLQKELDKLKRQLFHLSAVVEENFQLSIKAVFEGDVELGKKVRERDDEIDQLEVEVEEECLKILALHQPVAIDLRFLIVALKMNNDLERIGDLAVNIASGKACAAGEAMTPDLGARLQEMGEMASIMLRQSLEGLMAMDPVAARVVLAADDDVDDKYYEFAGLIKGLITSEPDRAKAYISWLMAAKSIERVADHATNIAEDTIYSVEGEIVRHGRG
ncbi:MAG: phosphate signaling complex protein PhoU [Candidatus Krumholzibacteria bacterium]|nr:phosphate signaling complex protein PhoU [Candidatus Krumholzibacteria bacterium]